jgi:thiamine pyrophosphate-dependent acetolactate synthase large subunit-like protein
MDGHDAVIELLDAEGVDTIFTLMSEDTMALMSELEEEWEDRIRMVKTRHEQGAMAMADGYARSNEEFGVCMVGRGPAVAQTGNAMVTARKKGSDVLAIVPTTSLSAEYDIKEFEQEEYLRSTIGNVVSVRSEETLVPKLERAIRELKVGDGPLTVQIPWDILDGSADVSGGIGPVETPRSGGRLQPDPDDVERAIDLYVESDAFQPPVVLAGRGAVESGAREALETLAGRTSALLTSSLQGRNYFEDHPFYLGFNGEWGTNLANRYTSEADLVFAFGASLNPYTTDDGHVFGEETRVIHVDNDPGGIGRYADVTLGIEGDARVTAEALLEELRRRGIDRDGELWSDDLRETIAETSPMNDREYPETPGTVDPRELVSELNGLLPDSKKVVTDGGHLTRWVMDGIHTPPDDFTFTLDFASIGLGLPMGIGTAVAADKPCVTVCGDAGLMMSIQELETAVRNDVSMTVVVMNDSSLNSEYHSLEAKGEEPGVALVEAPDFAAVAESLGAEGRTVRSIEQLRGLEEELGSPPDGPLVVDCKVNHLVKHRSKR